MDKYDNGERHLEEINHVSVLESVDEVFDNATSLMTQNAVMYGSTVTALITGLPICADLDIAVSNQEYMKLCKNFASSVKWVQVDGKRVAEHKPESSSHSFNLPSLSAGHSSDKNPYKDVKYLPISKMVSFEAVNRSRVQIVESKTMTGDRLEDALEVVRRVDFTFCGMAIDRYGRMLEVIPHAYDDCRQRVIRIQNYRPAMDLVRMKGRLLKYIKRGWGLTISIDQAIANLNRAKAEDAKKATKKIKRKKPRPMALFKIKKSVKMGFTLETKTVVRKMIGATSPIRDAVRSLAARYFRIDVVESTVNSKGDLIFWAHKNVMSGSIAKELADRASEYIIKKYKLSPDKIRQEDKTSKLGEMYASPKQPTAKYGGYISSASATSSASYGSDW